MPTKRQQADQAYERQEDQRALAQVLESAERDARGEYGFTNRDLLAAVERVKANLLKVAPKTEKPEPSVVGQMNLIDGSLESCPECGAPEWQWAPMMLDFGEEPKLQCGNCAAAFVVTFAQYNAVVAERKRTIGTSDEAMKRATRQPKVRGAG